MKLPGINKLAVLILFVPKGTAVFTGALKIC